ncbi:GIN domain-containing protein [Pedobacter sp. MR2016-24]|uniref:GIN domain-containing protein n=1 Tax=Pedobacter sp. MR2016-24 TaxID=2994466 RepID=UPI0022459572|nr:DUF2807 domain-containing protein [Pedobacter sp. MR2016-24]MCX2485797.1 DUF2807 domain-containing protein [Pedobacter sp. MR2016-24]
MKTLFNTVLKSGSIAIILLASVFSLTATAATFTAEMGINNQDIKKVIITGNTKVILIQGPKEHVTMDELDLEKVSLKQVGNTLTISSNESSPVTVFVYVKDIYRIDASDNSSVRTSGNFNLENLQVMLKDDASARVKATTGSLYTTINDRAKLELIGTSESHVSRLAGVAKMDIDQFAAVNTDYVAVSDEVIAFNSPKK